MILVFFQWPAFNWKNHLSVYFDTSLSSSIFQRKVSYELNRQVWTVVLKDSDTCTNQTIYSLQTPDKYVDLLLHFSSNKDLIRSQDPETSF